MRLTLTLSTLNTLFPPLSLCGTPRSLSLIVDASLSLCFNRSGIHHSHATMLQNRVPLEQQVLPLEEPHLYESRPNAIATVKDSGLTLPAIPHLVP